VKFNLDILATAVVYFIAGSGLVFAPQEILEALGQQPASVSIWALQLLGAAMLGMGWMNYLNKHTPVGGIYGKPLMLQNLLFAFPAFFFSITTWGENQDQSIFLFAAIVFGVIAAAFIVRMKSRGPGGSPSPE